MYYIVYFNSKQIAILHLSPEQGGSPHNLDNQKVPSFLLGSHREPHPLLSDRRSNTLHKYVGVADKSSSLPC